MDRTNIFMRREMAFMLKKKATLKIRELKKKRKWVSSASFDTSRCLEVFLNVNRVAAFANVYRWRYWNVDRPRLNICSILRTICFLNKKKISMRLIDDRLPAIWLFNTLFSFRRRFIVCRAEENQFVEWFKGNLRVCETWSLWYFKNQCQIDSPLGQHCISAKEKKIE